MDTTRPAFAIGDHVQLKSGGTVMTVLDRCNPGTPVEGHTVVGWPGPGRPVEMTIYPDACLTAAHPEAVASSSLLG